MFFIMDKKEWWKGHRNAIFSAIISAVIGYFIGFCLDSHIRIQPELEIINNRIDSLAYNLALYHEDANVAIKYVEYNPPSGTPCKVGINNNIKDHFVAVDAENSHGLKPGDIIYLINENERDFSISTKIVFVQIVKDSPKSSADFFLNKAMLKSLNIGPEKLSQGVFTIHYKRHDTRDT